MGRPPGAKGPDVIWQEIEAVASADRLGGGAAASSANALGALHGWLLARGKAGGWANGAQGIRWLGDIW